MSYNHQPERKTMIITASILAFVTFILAMLAYALTVNKKYGYALLSLTASIICSIYLVNICKDLSGQLITPTTAPGKPTTELPIIPE
jgi:hypothetical protein